MPEYIALPRNPLVFAFRLLAVLLLFLTVSYGFYAWHLVKHERLQQLRHLSDFTSKAAEQFFDHYAGEEQLLGQALADIGYMESPERAMSLLARFKQANPDLASITLFNPRGQVLLSTAAKPGQALPNLRGKRRIWDNPARFLPRAGVNIGRPVRGSLLNRFIIPIRYPIRNAQGRLLFVLSCNILVSNQQAIWRYLALPDQAVIGLIRQDGHLQSRWPAGEHPNALYSRPMHGALREAMLAHPGVAHGHFEGRSDGDHRYRFGAFTRLEHYPLTAFVSLPNSVIWNDWIKEIELPLIIIGMLALAGWLIYRRTVRMQEANEAERRRSEKQLIHLANHDTLTGLPNRALFRDRLEQAMLHAQRHEKLLALLFLDLDRFKAINDTFGHPVGDKLLQAVAERLKEQLRAGDTISRVGGDEFTLILEDIRQVEEAALAAQRILAALKDAFVLEGQEIFISTSIGITIFPFDDEDLDRLLLNADTAMYRAKALGRNNFQFYTADMHVRLARRLQLEHHLRHALKHNEFALRYQPTIDLHSGQINGMEALLHWRHPEWGVIPPSEFIPVAEETGLITPLGEWVLREACAQYQAWEHDGLSPVPIAVNLSTRQFTQPPLTQTLARTLSDYNASPCCLILELTESILMNNADEAIAVLHEIKAMGFSLSIDDFGTGYSSLSYLKRFPIDRLKIDRSFVKEIPGNPEDVAITRAIIALAHSLGLRVVAEGVESEAQAAFLRAHGCDEVQGFYFGAPMAAAEMARWLRDRHSQAQSG